jgi:CubicO group peptidase (beta-lactamase class C family)
MLKVASRLALVALLLCSQTLAPFLAPRAQSNAAPVVNTSAPTGRAAALKRIEEALEARRKELNIPGMSLVIVKDDQVIYLKGLGVKDFERGTPVTPDTLFAIGSSSKAFTAMTAVMSQDEGKLSLDDSPKKFLPYFRLQDPDADARIVLRDLLSHRSGLNRTDLVWITGKLSREEVIRVAGQAKPTAKLGEKFLYQNVMYTAAGEAVARAQKESWDEVIKRRIFKPLGMTASVTTVPEMQRAKDYSFGYEYAPATKITRRLPFINFPAVAPAGAINSSARDMAQWVRLMLGGGVFEGKRLVSEAGMAELVKPHISIAPKLNYGLGWFLREWKGKRVVEHGGNIAGFNALVALMPEERLGFALLTNVTSSPIGQAAMETVWSNLAGAGEVAPAAKPAIPPGDAQRLIGKYLYAKANLTIEITTVEGNLTAVVPGQPAYTLKDTGGGRYQLTKTGTPLPGYFISFRPVQTNEAELELFLEQPQGNISLNRIKPADPQAAGDTANNAAATETLRTLVGRYAPKTGSANVEIVERDGRYLLVVPGQPSYPLFSRQPDVFSVVGMPDSYSVRVDRDAAGKITGITLRQPQGDFPLTRAAQFNAPLTVEELMNKVVNAMGGEQPLRRLTSLQLTVNVIFESQGLTGTGTISQRAPNLYREEGKLIALGKEIATLSEVFDGVRGIEMSTFSPPSHMSGAELADMRTSADFYAPLNWRTLFKKIEITGMKKVGEEETYVVVKTPAEGHPVTDYVSTTTFLILRRDSLSSSSTSEATQPVTTLFSDFRPVAGVLMPFRSVTTQPSTGTVVVEVKEARANVVLPDALFHVPAESEAAKTGRS